MSIDAPYPSNDPDETPRRAQGPPTNTWPPAPQSKRYGPPPSEHDQSSPSVIDTWPFVPHYVEGRKIEPILVIEDWNLDFHLGNVIKYIAKLGRDGVDSLTTLKKAQSYLDRAVHVQLMRDCPF